MSSRGRGAVRQGPWVFGALANNQGSFAGWGADARRWRRG
jgi:hypothetical protein